jgi:uncharacterized membrane protein YphA (DoxX/SURF4 family)
VTRLLIIAAVAVAYLAVRRRAPDSAVRIVAAFALVAGASLLLGAANRIAGIALASVAVAVGLALSARRQLAHPPDATS